MSNRRPLIMVAPNGARLSKADHPELPLTIPEIIATARACRAAGADAIHTHVRDANGRHVLDKGLYAELLAEMAREVPGLPVQITTEAAGRYAPAEQYAMLDVPGVTAISAALREISSDPEEAARRRFYWQAREQGVALQHILYDPGEVAVLADARRRGLIPPEPLDLLFVLGSYQGREAIPADLQPFRSSLEAARLPEGAHYMVACFGRRERACLIAATQYGGDCRIGFENNLMHPDGTPLRDNAESVAMLVAALADGGLDSRSAPRLP